MTWPPCLSSSKRHVGCMGAVCLDLIKQGVRGRMLQGWRHLPFIRNTCCDRPAAEQGIICEWFASAPVVRSWFGGEGPKKEWCGWRDKVLSSMTDFVSLRKSAKIQAMGLHEAALDLGGIVMFIMTL